jgi:hypothetical protein
MATNIRIISARDFVKATPEGQFDFEESKEFLISVASVASALNDHQILIDTRKTDCELSPGELWHLASELDVRRGAFLGRTAVLCPAERFDQAGFFALCAHNRGFRVKAFASFEEAIEWLMSDPD